MEDERPALQQPTVVTLSQEALDAHAARKIMRARAKPDPLKFMSTTSMLSIPESPGLFRQVAEPTQGDDGGGGFIMPPGGLATFEVKAPGQQVRKNPANFMSGPPSIPPTPVQQWELATPTGTPTMATQVLLQADAAVRQQVAARQTLSLVDMIQSPQGELKPVMMPGVYQQQTPQQVYSQPPPSMVVQPAPAQYVQPPLQSFSAPAPSAAASVMLGLVSQPAPQPQRAPPTTMATGTLQAFAATQAAAPTYAAPPMPGQQLLPRSGHIPPPPMMAAPAAVRSPQGAPPMGVAFPPGALSSC